MRFQQPFEPGDRLDIDPSWPLRDGLIFAVTNNDGASGLVTPVGSSRDLTTLKPASAGLIHTSAAPWGRGRNRTDAASPLKWSSEERHLFANGDFTVAFYGWLRGGAASQNILSNNEGGNQWRFMQHFDGAAYSFGKICFWTYDGGTTYVATDSSGMLDAPAWYVARRSGTTHEIFRNGVLLATATGTARNVTGASVSATKAISMSFTIGAASYGSTGLHGPGLVWRRALSMPEISQLVGGPVFDFVAKPRSRLSVNLTLASYTSPADPGTINISGVDSVGIRALLSATNTGSISLTGYDATSTESAAGATVSSADPGSIALTGYDATSTATVSSADPGRVRVFGNKSSYTPKTNRFSSYGV